MNPPRASPVTDPCWCGDAHEPHCPTCDKCGAPLTSGFMAVFCPAVERCEFWPARLEDQEFIRQLRAANVGAEQ